MYPVAALKRIAFLLDRRQTDTFRGRAYRRVAGRLEGVARAHGQPMEHPGVRTPDPQPVADAGVGRLQQDGGLAGAQRTPRVTSPHLRTLNPDW